MIHNMKTTYTVILRLDRGIQKKGKMHLNRSFLDCPVKHVLSYIEGSGNDSFMIHDTNSRKLSGLEVCEQSDLI